MKYKDIFLTASSNMFRSKLRTLLTIIAIFIGAFTLTLTNGLGAGISSYIDKQVGNLGQAGDLTITVKSTSEDEGLGSKPQKYEPGKQISVDSGDGGPAESIILLTDKDIEEIKANKNLSSVQATYLINADYIESSNGEKYNLIPSTISASSTLNLAAGKQLVADSPDYQLALPVNYVSSLGFANNEAAIGQKVTIAITDAIRTQHSVGAVIVSVQQSGITNAGGAVLNNSLKNKLNELQSIGLPDTAKGTYESVTAKVTGDTSDIRIADIKKELDTAGYTATSLKDQLGSFKTILSAVTYVLNGFAVIALLAASFGIVNTLLMSVQERTKEIGLMKAMGMRSNRIFSLFSLEAILIGFWGSVFGVGLAMLLGTIANKVTSGGLLKDLPGFNLLVFPAKSIGLIVLLIMVIAFLAGTLPARRASKQNPIDALRYE